MLKTTIADLRAREPQALGHTDWIEVDQARVDLFADATLDWQWFHNDPERAASGPFEGTIAHGYLTLSLVSRFLLELLVVTDAGLTLNYGLDRVRFPSPLRVGSEVRGTGELTEVRALDNGVQSSVRITVETPASPKPVCVAEVLTRFLTGELPTR